MKTLAERFWSKVEKSDGCWLWTAAARGDGYGAFRAGGKLRQAHRVAFELSNGPVPEGLCVCHQCDVRACVNPAHLFLGSNAENLADRDAKGRAARGETNGQSKLTATQVVEIRAATGPRSSVAARFGVSPQHVSRIRAGTSWARLSESSADAGAAK